MHASFSVLTKPSDYPLTSHHVPPNHPPPSTPNSLGSTHRYIVCVILEHSTAYLGWQAQQMP